MRIDYIEVSGFRGFRERARIECGQGFTVITGRNGAGKSTICDAVEFAITGVMDKYVVEKTGMEGLSDYVWWRGDGRPEAYYVRVAFLGDDGRPFVITRARESGSDKTFKDIQTVLCGSGAPDDALKELMRTTIMRDEWIASLSLDLRETERFEFVRGALGAPEGAGLAVRAREVVSAAEEASKQCESSYEKARTQLADMIAQQSEVKAALTHSGDVALAMKTLAHFVPSISSDVAGALETGHKALVDARLKLKLKDAALEVGRELAQENEKFHKADALSARELVTAELECATKATFEAEKEVAERKHEVVLQEESNATAASLLLLVEHGERLGLFDGRCPLCATTQTSGHFHAGLDAARKRMATLSLEVHRARSMLVTAQERFRENSERLRSALMNADEWKGKEAQLEELQQVQTRMFAELGLQLELTQDPRELEVHINRERGEVIDLERALLMLESSQLISKLASLGNNIEALRERVGKHAEAVGRARKALSLAKQLDRSVRRVGAEIIDERLAEISPLLNELYERLRPHNDWRTIEYSIRGDVRRFLSLKVGQGLNPQFVFSSGQRRAAGIAFLLSVHLAKAWAHLRSLVLDDPVQHIDDFRALQLVEVLAALRREGRQVICAVEDTALADLLCRRLPTTASEGGRRVDIGLGAHGTVRILENLEVAPMPAAVMNRGRLAAVSG